MPSSSKPSRFIADVFPDEECGKKFALEFVDVVTLLAQQVVVLLVLAAVGALLRVKGFGGEQCVLVANLVFVRFDALDEEPFAHGEEDRQVVQKDGRRLPAAMPGARNVRSQLETEVAERRQRADGGSATPPAAAARSPAR